MSVLTAARNELFSRPQDEHFPDFRSLTVDASQQKLRCVEVDAKDTSIEFDDDGQHIRFGDQLLRLTHFCLGQLAALCRVPMPVLKRLEGATRAQVLNQTFPRTKRYKVGLVDGDRLRCVTSDRYERVWDADILQEVDRWLLPSGFIPAMPTINTDVYGTNALGTTKPALFRGDRDMFAFFYGDQQPGDDGFGGLRKGVMVFNSEVGAKSFGFSTFWFREMCANFLIWNPTDIKAQRARHMGSVRELVRAFRKELMGLGATITDAELDVFQRAKETRFVSAGPDEDVRAAQRLQREFRLSAADAREAVELVRDPLNPGDFTVWGVVNGLTSAAKGPIHAADRAARSELAGRVMELVR